jgi:glycosyltransferase involved in cell wall biosynthesis
MPGPGSCCKSTASSIVSAAHSGAVADVARDGGGIPVPVLSVVVPALEVDLELRRCLDSVRLALPDSHECEIVLVLPARLVNTAAAAFPAVRVVAESRPSVYAAMNDGVAVSRGRYLYFLGKDDILLPSAREVVRLLIAQAPAVVFANVYWGNRGVCSTRSSRWGILLRNVCHQGIVYSREAIVLHGPYVRRFRVRADQLLNIRVLWDASLRGRTRYVPLPLAWYAATGLSLTTPDKNFYRVQATIIRRYLGPVAAGLWRAYKWLRPEKGMG